MPVKLLYLLSFTLLITSIVNISAQADELPQCLFDTPFIKDVYVHVQADELPQCLFDTPFVKDVYVRREVDVQADELSSCPDSQLEDNLNITIPCAGVEGVHYAANLTFVGNEEGELLWKLDHVTTDVNCQWNPETCLTIDEQFNLVFPNITIDKKNYTAFLQKLPEKEAGFYWQYDKHELRQPNARSVSHGTVAAYAQPQLKEGTGRKLLAIYMVGSDLESKYGLATQDLKELIAGYQALVEKNVDVIVAFGGTKKPDKSTNEDGVKVLKEDSTWHGVKFADMEQLIEDFSTDKRFGDADNYLYQDERAHLGDVSTLTHFLSYLQDAYTNHEQTFFVFWNHGGSYNGIGFDQYYGMDPLSLEEVQQALNSTQSHFNLIGFDACLMASMETANYLYQHADYLLASEELEPGHGWNWTDVITQYSHSATIIDVAKNMIDNYVKTETHGEESSNKTLSVVDLSHFETVKNHTNLLLNELISQSQKGINLQSQEGINIIANTDSVTGESRNYGYGTSVDLYDLAINLIATLSNKINIQEYANSLLNELDKYIIYSRHDGSVPGSYGVTINKINNEPKDITLSSSVNTLQKTWISMVKEDTEPPKIERQGPAKVKNAQLYENLIDSEYLEALKSFKEGISLTGDQQRLLEPLPTSDPLTAEQKDFLQQVYDILSNDELSLDVKLINIDELGNQPAAVYPSSIFIRGIKALEFKGIKNTRRGNWFNNKVIFPFLQGERAAFTYQAYRNKTPSRKTSNLSGEIQGTVASFSDNVKVVKVTTIMGRIRPDIETGERFFLPVAELETYPTKNGYFTPTWNRVWYRVEYKPGSSQWIPMIFESRYINHGKTYTIYSAKIRYRDADIDYSGVKEAEEDCAEAKEDCAKTEEACSEAGFIFDTTITAYDTTTTNQCVEEGILQVHIDDNNKVIFHKITPNTTDKASVYLEIGDKVKFLYEKISMEPGNSNKIESTTTGFVTFTQKPEFVKKALIFANIHSGDGLPIFQYYYAMRARDSAGNSVVTEPVIAPVEMPSCARLNETRPLLQDAYQYLSAGNIIKDSFSTIMGANFERVADNLTPVAETWINPIFTNNFYEFFKILYNGDTFAYSSDNSGDWVWDGVPWDEVKTKLDVIVPAFEEIYHSQCLDEGII